MPAPWIALACAAAGLFAVEAARQRAANVVPAIAAFAAVTGGWALEPFARVAEGVLETMFGQPLFATALPVPRQALLLFVGPAAVLAGALVQSVGASAKLRRAGLIAFAVVAGAGLLVLFKQVFAIADDGDFVARGMAERLVLTTILYAAGWAAWRLSDRREGWAAWLRPFAFAVTLLALARTIGFDVLIYNPLFRAQAVGALPLANLLAPAYLLPLGWLWQARRDARLSATRMAQVEIALVLAYAAAAVRQLFHGSMVAGVALPQGEDIAFSLVAIAVAVGFLLWGIRVRLRAWRIASLALMLGALAKVFLLDASGLEGLARIGSFVALGFSLIGIGWLYSRYLTLEKPTATG